MNKIAVYTICKNEEKFVNKWLDSMSEADYMVVLDTGSTDATIKLLEEGKKKYPNLIYAQKIIDPWRFDVARNANMDLIPKDANILFENDLDEWLAPGWSKPIRERWIEGVHERGEYMYAWSHLENGDPARVFRYNKLHTWNWRWKAPVHEYLARVGVEDRAAANYTAEETIDFGFDVFLHHYPDPAKSRGSYLGLLELRCSEDPDDEVAPVYLAHEYSYRGKYQKSIDLLQHLIDYAKTYTDLERANFYMFMGDDYLALGQAEIAVQCYLKAISKAPEYRDPYMHLAEWLQTNNYNLAAIGYVREALKRTVRQYSWLEGDAVWSYVPYDILSRAYFYLGEYAKSAAAAATALSKDPNNKRLQDNWKIIQPMLVDFEGDI